MRVQRYKQLIGRASVAVALVLLLALPASASAAINKIPTPDPGAGSYGLEATKTQPPPTQGATISVPGSGASFSTSPITVSGICPKDLLVQVYNNGVMVGSVDCANGSFSLQVSLFVGQNELTASVFDSLDQTGPASNTVAISYNNASFSAFGAIMTLTSNYGRRAANPNATLTWPLVLAGGTGPYAFSIDWGDGTPSALKSQATAGQVDISHVYKKAGVYHVIVKATDANGVTAFLQLTAVSNGQVSASETTVTNVKTTVVNKVMWAPVAIAFVLLFPAYWFGRRSQMVSLHKQLEKNMESYKDL